MYMAFNTLFDEKQLCRNRSFSVALFYIKFIQIGDGIQTHFYRVKNAVITKYKNFYFFTLESLCSDINCNMNYIIFHTYIFNVQAAK